MSNKKVGSRKKTCSFKRISKLLAQRPIKLKRAPKLPACICDSRGVRLCICGYKEQDEV